MGWVICAGNPLRWTFMPCVQYWTFGSKPKYLHLFSVVWIHKFRQRGSVPAALGLASPSSALSPGSKSPPSSAPSWSLSAASACSSALASRCCVCCLVCARCGGWAERLIRNNIGKEANWPGTKDIASSQQHQTNAMKKDTDAIDNNNVSNIRTVQSRGQGTVSTRVHDSVRASARVGICVSFLCLLWRSRPRLFCMRACVCACVCVCV